MHILQKIKHALAMKSPQPHTQHLKKSKGGDKKKQKKWDKQKATKPDGRNKLKQTRANLYS